MRFIRSRPGVVLWCAIALIIAIVPLWRLRAVRQWNFASVQATLMPDYNSAPILVAGQPKPTPVPIPYGFTAADEAAARQRFPNEPIARLARLNTGDLWREVNAITGPVSLSSYAQKDQLAQQKAQRKKLNPRIWKLTDAYFARYDDLLRRFPDSKLVRAQYLRDVLSVTNIADEGPLSRKDEERTDAEYLASLKYDSPASPATLDKAIRVARDGARLQPDNAYFPWAEAIFQFAQKRPERALNALEAAGRCANFDDYTFEGVQRRVELLQRLRATGWEDELTEWAGFLFPHYSKMRSATRAATGQMRLARRRGDEKTAFRWAAATARASYPVVRSQRNSIICKLVGQALCHIVWRATIENEPNVPEISRVPDETEAQYADKFARYIERTAARFARFASAGGDEALARQTLAILPAFDGSELAVYAGKSFPTYFNRLSDFYWLGAQLLRLSLGGALVWIICFFATRKRSAQVAATRQRMLLPAMFCAGATGALLVGALTLAPKLDALIGGAGVPPGEESLPIFVIALRDYWPALIVAVWAFVLFGVPLWARAWRFKGTNKIARQKKPLSLTRVIAALVAFAALLGILFWIVGSVPAGRATDALVYIVLIAAGVTALGASFALIWRAHGPKRAVAVCGVVAFWLLIAAPFAESSGADGPFYVFVLRTFAGLLILVAPILALRIWQLPLPQIKEFAFQIAVRTRIAAGVLALLCAVAYAGITLWTIPVEAQTRAMMARQLQIGGVAWLREQMKNARGE